MQRAALSLTLIVAAAVAWPGLAGGQQPAAESRAESFRLPIALVSRDRSSPQVTRAASSSSGPALALPPRGAEGPQPAATRPGRALITTVTSLAVVLGLFLLLVWFQRRTAAGRSSGLPGEVLQTLGRVPLNGRQEMHLVRVGNKLLLLAVTATSAETLTEITDPAEIARLSGICLQNQPGSLSASFREILSQLQRQPSAAGLQYASGR